VLTRDRVEASFRKAQAHVFEFELAADIVSSRAFFGSVKISSTRPYQVVHHPGDGSGPQIRNQTVANQIARLQLAPANSVVAPLRVVGANPYGIPANDAARVSQ